MNNIKKSNNDVHSIYHNFCNYMKKWYFKETKYGKFIKNKYVETNKIIKEFNPAKMIGYNAMCRIDRYIKKHPEIKVVIVDDDVFSTSYIVLIPHPTMGITMIIVPQCTDVLNVAFLHPDAYKSLINTIKEIEKTYRKHKCQKQ